MDNECILCGRCTMVCPQSQADKKRFALGKTGIEEKQKMIVRWAPSYAAAYPGVSLPAFRALKRLS
ncbi:MAG: 4Fe-4S binding protein [Christensenellales bacterium]